MLQLLVRRSTAPCLLLKPAAVKHNYGSDDFYCKLVQNVITKRSTRVICLHYRHLLQIYHVSYSYNCFDASTACVQCSRNGVHCASIDHRFVYSITLGFLIIFYVQAPWWWCCRLLLHPTYSDVAFRTLKVRSGYSQPRKPSRIQLSMPRHYRRKYANLHRYRQDTKVRPDSI